MIKKTTGNISPILPVYSCFAHCKYFYFFTILHPEKPTAIYQSAITLISTTIAFHPSSNLFKGWNRTFLLKRIMKFTSSRKRIQLHFVVIECHPCKSAFSIIYLSNVTNNRILTNWWAKRKQYDCVDIRALPEADPIWCFSSIQIPANCITAIGSQHCSTGILFHSVTSKKSSD